MKFDKNHQFQGIIILIHTKSFIIKFPSACGYIKNLLIEDTNTVYRDYFHACQISISLFVQARHHKD
jgi:hypothetical protein